MIRGTCRFCENYLVVNDKLEVVNPADETSLGIGKAHIFKVKAGKTYIICPECCEIIRNLK